MILLFLVSRLLRWHWRIPSTNSNYNPSRIGVGVGSGVGGLPSIEKASLTLMKELPQELVRFLFLVH